MSQLFQVALPATHLRNIEIVLGVVEIDHS
jgi:hypothetical protein